MFGRFSVYDLSVIPLFMLMGAFAMHGGLSKALFDFANALLGRFRGGMAMAGMLACAAFGSISGSSVATTATIAQVALPEMRRLNYSGRLATAALAAGGTLGILLPPSVTLMIYAILTEQNISKLFLAAYVPGIIAAAWATSSRSRSIVRLVPGARAEDRGAQPRRVPAQHGERVADPGDLPGRVRRHLRRVLHADRRRLDRHHDDLLDRAAARRAWAARDSCAACCPPRRPAA